LNGHYSVFNPRGQKIADCGIERDAVNLMSMRNRRWDGHYFTFNPLPGDIFDISNNQLPPNQKYLGWKNVTEEEFNAEFIVVGKQKLPTQQLPPNCQEPFIPDFHD
jgi:hypothetical protein